jgi:hypothetical protein
MKPILTTRKAYNQNGTLYVAIPKAFAARHHIKAGDELIILADETMRVLPRESWDPYGKPEVSGRFLRINGQLIPLED